MTSPAPGSTLAGSSATFQWTAGTGTSGNHWFRVGTTGAGSYDVSASLYTGTSASISGLPTNGGTIYVRLYSQNASTSDWVFTDYSYTAYNGSGPAFTASAMTSPAPGSTLAGSSATFQWTAGTGTSGNHWFRVGTTGAGSYDVSASLYTGTSASISGLPTNGGTIYVRLYSQNASTSDWVFTDYSYTAYNGSGPAFTASAMTSPAPGSTLAGSSATFQWTAGTATSGNHWFRVGTTGAGSYDVSASLYTGTSASISGLPTNGGTIYVRLYSQNASTSDWVFTDYSYTAYNGSGPAFTASAMTSPAPGSTLAGSSATFQWTAGTATSGNHWFRVGTTGAGSYDVSASLYTGTSASISGLPTNGGTIYVRLYSQNASTSDWVFTDYSYTAYNGSGPAFTASAMTSPAPGSTLAGSSATFQWTAGTGTSGNHWFRVGTTGAGSYDVSASLYTGTSASISGLPTNGGTIYVRLYSQNASTSDWVFTDYSYTAY